MLIHVVEQGETLSSIAQNYGTSVWKLETDNKLPNPNVLVPGQTLVILYPGEEEERRPFGNLKVNGYAYSYIDRQILRQALPSLTSLTIFGYGFRMDGSLIPTDDNELIQMAVNANVQPVMLLSSITEQGTFSSENASQLFANAQLQTILLQNIVNTMQIKGYVGLDIDFEYVKREDKENFIAFIEQAANTLHPYGYFINVDLAPKTSAEQAGLLYEAHDYRRIGEIADRVLLMTYEWGYTYGPPMAVAPLPQVRRVVEYALTEIDRSKIFMGIPNYGYNWPLPYVRGETMAVTLGNDAAVQLAARYGADIQFDETAMSPYFNYTDEDGIAHVVWFEDARSIDAKLRLIHENRLIGAGYWNLMKPFTQNWLVLNSLFYITKEI